MRVLHPSELSTEEISLWDKLQYDQDALRSPYFRPEFAIAVGSICDCARVGVIEEDGAQKGFFPFRLNRRRIAGPIASSLTDFQGLILDNNVTLDPCKLIQDCGLSAWRFDHLLAAQTPFDPFHRKRTESPYLDLTAGFDAYAQQRKEAGSKLISQVLRKSRKIEREVGPLRFTLHTTNDEPLKRMLAWKIAQYDRIRSVNHLAPAWTVELLKKICAIETPRFAGLLSTLHVGPNLAAVHLGMRSANTIHWWFPTYDRGLEKYSPGLILLLRLAMAAEEIGATRIDLGKGEERYKSSFTSGTTLLAEGAIDFRPVAGRLEGGFAGLCDWIRSSPLRVPVQGAVRSIRSWKRAMWEMSK